MAEKSKALRFTAVAQLATSRAARKKFGIRYEHVRGGTKDLYISHEHEAGWPIALRLKPGQKYEVVVEPAAVQARNFKELPRDQKLPDGGIVFHNFAQPMQEHRDPADMRRVVRGHVGIWTDGLMVSSSQEEAGTMFEVKKVYRVEVRPVASEAVAAQ